MTRSNSFVRIFPGEMREHHLGGATAAQARQGDSAARQRIAVVLSESGRESAPLLPVLAGLGITTLDRAFDQRSMALVSALNPDLAIAICDTDGPAGASMVRGLALSGVERIVVIDANASESASVAALQLGADVVLPEDAPADLLRATLLALTRRIATVAAPATFVPRQIRIGGLVVDHDACEVREGGEVVPLTPTEFRILAHLAVNSGKVQSARELMTILHDYKYSDVEAQQTIKVYVRRIRRKLEACATQSVEVVNSRSFGYKLQPIAGDLGAGNVAA